MITVDDLLLFAPDYAAGKSADYLQLHCDAAVGFAEIYIQRKLTPATYTEYYDGNAYERLQLNNYPIISVTSIHLDLSIPPAFGDDTLVSADDYTIDADSGTIILRALQLNGTWNNFTGRYPQRRYQGVNNYGGPPVFPRSPRSLKVVYRAGYESTHRRYSAIKMALLELASYSMQFAGAGGISENSRSYIDTSVSIGYLQMQSGKPPVASAIAVLDQLKPIVFAAPLFS